MSSDECKLPTYDGLIAGLKTVDLRGTIMTADDVLAYIAQHKAAPDDVAPQLVKYRTRTVYHVNNYAVLTQSAKDADAVAIAQRDGQRVRSHQYPYFEVCIATGVSLDAIQSMAIIKYTRSTSVETSGAAAVDEPAISLEMNGLVYRASDCASGDSDTKAQVDQLPLVSMPYTQATMRIHVPPGISTITVQWDGHYIADRQVREKIMRTPMRTRNMLYVTDGMISPYVSCSR